MNIRGMLVLAAIVALGGSGCSSKAEPLPPIDAPAGSSVVFLGDSWTEGYGATPPSKGYSFELSAAMGWTQQVIPRGGGTGFLNRGPAGVGTYEERLRERAEDTDVDLLIIQGGLNDAPVEGSDSAAFDKAAESVIRLGEQKYPNAQVLVVGPLDPESPEPWALIKAIDTRLASVSDELGVRYVSPTQEEWFPDEAAVARYVDEKKASHPNTAGHAYLAERLAEAIG